MTTITISLKELIRTNRGYEWFLNVCAEENVSGRFYFFTGWDKYGEYGASNENIKQLQTLYDKSEKTSAMFCVLIEPEYMDKIYREALENNEITELLKRSNFLHGLSQDSADALIENFTLILHYIDDNNLWNTINGRYSVTVLVLNVLWKMAQQDVKEILTNAKDFYEYCRDYFNACEGKGVMREIEACANKVVELLNKG